MKKPISYVLILTLAIFCFLLGSCKKDPNLSRPISFLAVYNATSNVLNFKIGARDENSAAIQRGNSSGYIGVYEGRWLLEASLNDNPPTRKSINADLIGDELQSIFVLRSDSLEFFSIKDDLNLRNPARAMVKFLNLSPDATSLTLEMELLSNTTLFSDVKYKSPTGYQDFDEKSSYNINLKNHATGDVLIDTNRVFDRGKLYTIWTTGRLDGTTTANRLNLHITEVR